MVQIIKDIPPEEIIRIPAYLVRDEIEDFAYPYKGWELVLSEEKTFEDIMGSSVLQSFILELMEIYFFTEFPNRKQYRFLGNELGSNLSKNVNLSYGKALFAKADLPKKDLQLKYTNLAPKVVIEVDVKVDTMKKSELHYIHQKVEKMFGHGVERVIWIFSDPNQIFLFEPNQAARYVPWDTDVEFTDGHYFNLQQLYDAAE